MSFSRIQDGMKPPLCARFIKVLLPKLIWNGMSRLPWRHAYLCCHRKGRLCIFWNEIVILLYMESELWWEIFKISGHHWFVVVHLQLLLHKDTKTHRTSKTKEIFSLCVSYGRVLYQHKTGWFSLSFLSSVPCELPAMVIFMNLMAVSLSPTFFWFIH